MLNLIVWACMSFRGKKNQWVKECICLSWIDKVYMSWIWLLCLFVSPKYTNIALFVTRQLNTASFMCLAICLFPNKVRMEWHEEVCIQNRGQREHLYVHAKSLLGRIASEPAECRLCTCVRRFGQGKKNTCFRARCIAKSGQCNGDKVNQLFAFATEVAWIGFFP